MIKRLLFAVLLTAAAAPARADHDAFELFDQEARVVTASQRPMTVAQAPATVRVVTGDDIRARGVRTVWDALRTVPGVDVTQTRAFQGEVGIRGMNGPLNNRVLVLLDGRTVLNATFNQMTWTSLPVPIEEIDRIEVVEGPASALYGANAISGVINIITKTPAQLSGGLASMTAGEAGYYSASSIYGARRGAFDYKASLSATGGNKFENEGVFASKTGTFHALAGYDFSPATRLSVSGGFAQFDTQTSIGQSGSVYESGLVSFLRADLRAGKTAVSAFWNQERGVYREAPALGNAGIDYDLYDLNARRSLDLPFANSLVLGGNYRRISSRSTVLGPGAHAQDLWSLFLEDEWRPHEQWTVVASGRLDRHPLTTLAFSPRASVIYTPVPEHTLRATAGTSFRNPTLVECYIQFTTLLSNPPGGAIANPPFSNISIVTSGRRDLAAERMFQAEVAHSGRFGPVTTTLTGWFYRINGLIGGTTPTAVSFIPPTVGLTSSFVNHGGVKALGFEAAAEARVSRSLTSFGNYSYQSLRDDDPSVQTTARSAPRHSANAGFTAHRGGRTFSLWGTWVDQTFWNQSTPGSPIVYTKVPDYYLLGVRAAHAFTGRWDGLELSVSVFNLLDRRHYEILPAASAAMPGLSGEVVRRRVTATAAYRF